MATAAFGRPAMAKPSDPNFVILSERISRLLRNTQVCNKVSKFQGFKDENPRSTETFLKPWNFYAESRNPETLNLEA